MTTAIHPPALLEEAEAINSIYGPDTLILDPSPLTAILTIPSYAFTFRFSFPPDYPKSPPTVGGIASTGEHGKPGDGEAALRALREVVGRAFIPGQVCLFDVIEDAAETIPGVLSHDDHGSGGTDELDAKSDESPDVNALTSIAPDQRPIHSISSTTTTTDIPQWFLSTPITFKKSTFLAHAAHATSPAQAHSYLAHLKSSDKKIAAATHNIFAYRVRSPAPKTGSDQVSIIQDCDDDGESAAGGGLLRLLQLMDVSDVVVVVTRWFGGVLLGGDRFRIINQVAREAMLGVVEGRGGGGKEGRSNGGGKGRKGK